jgi:hypothetical protein
MRRFASIVFAVMTSLAFAGKAPAIDIGPMTWTPRADWINVKNPSAIPAFAGYKGAVGDGVADDTAAIQAIFKYIEKNNNGAYLTVYFPAGTYKITQTLTSYHTPNVSLIGCGSDTKISWAGQDGGAMFWPQGVDNMRYVGLTWLGNNHAAVAYEECSYQVYSGGLRHENESFHDFTAKATYVYQDAKGQQITTPTPPTAAILSGYPAGLTGETQIFNCVFINCETGVYEAWQTGNFFCWFIEGCEFEKCGVGINLHWGGGNSVANCHFDHCTTADILGGGDTHIRHCTSVGGGYFFADPGSDQNPLDANIIEDCWTDGWSNGAYAIKFDRSGPNTVFDCTFTNPPAQASGLIITGTCSMPSQLTLSNNYAPGFPAGAQMIQADPKARIDQVPQGLRFAALPLTSANQTFLHTTVPPGSTHIFDISLPPYRAMWTKPANQNGIPDISAAVQAAVNDAQKTGDGATAYIPTGIYNLSTTIKMTGSNYTVEGNGFNTMICWWGPKNGAMFAVDSPQNLRLQFLRLATIDSLSEVVRETSKTPCSMIYDGIHTGGYSLGNPGAGANLVTPPGVVLSDLPAGSTVFMPHLDGTLTVDNCGPANILIKYFSNPGRLTVSGTAPKSGFLGTIFTEGGGQVPGAYNILVNDNQDLIFGDYYVEQCFNDLQMLRGKGTEPGRVTIGGFNTFSGSNNGGNQPSQYTVNVDNYAGRLFYGGGMVGNWNNQYPASFNQTGDNPIDMIFMGNSFSKGVKYTVSSAANLISTLNIDMDPYPGVNIEDDPKTVTPSDYLSIAQAFDHFRQLEAVDLETEFGIKTDGPPVAQFSFEGNVLDMTGKYNGTEHDISYVPGLGMLAASFNGTDSSITTPAPALDGSFSIALWVRTTDKGGTDGWSKGHGLIDGFTSASGAGFGLWLDGGNVGFRVGKSETVLTSKTAINDGGWHHLVATRDSGGKMQLYIDAKLDGEVSGPAAGKETPKKLEIGAQNGSVGSFYKGTIDQLQIFSYVLSPVDIASLCNRTKDSMP